ncbi:hypothetical protein CP533_0341, partial [Ophiocordyceps camponoti-saundersi (nom. inval.)]
FQSATSPHYRKSFFYCPTSHPSSASENPSSSATVPIMETVSNMATQAAKLVWGGNSEEKEPISGAQGNVSHGEPFDAGNMDPSQQQTMSKTTGSNRDASTQSNAGASSLREDVGSNRQNTSRTVPATISAAGAERFKVTDDRERKSQVEEGVTNSRTPEDGTPQVGKVEEGVTNSRTPEDGTLQVGDRVTNSRTPEDGTSKSQPEDHGRGSKSIPRKGNASTSKATEESHFGDDGEDGDPNTSIMGDGPKPLNVVAKENGGDAGNNVDEKHKPDTDGEGGSGSSQQSKGTGEKHVMTSGFAADGGDFDATKPGAGREADRLMDQKKDQSGAGVDGTGSKESGNGQDKPSLGDRLKNKLHKH